MANDPQIGPHSKPLDVFRQWMTAAQSLGTIREPTAMCVSTLDPSGDLSSRMVLCKEWSDDGFTFYSNYESRKGQALASDPRVALLFYWDPMFRQVKINGTAVRTSRAQSEAYWQSRPRESQLSQFISRQSTEISSRAELESKRDQTRTDLKDRDIPCPAHWGGYLVIPQRIEFWIGQPNRLHDRFEFEKAGPTWTFRRLSP